MNSEGTEGERENNQHERPSPDRSSKNSLSPESEGPDSEHSQWDVVTINREVLDETKMDCYHPVPRHTRCPVPQPLRKSITPPRTARQWWDFLLLRLPIISWLSTYRLKYLLGDSISGVTVSVMHIPQGLAYALLANLPPVYGLYASFMPAIVYSFFGTSKHISIGTFAVVSLMVGNAISRLAESRSDIMFACQVEQSMPILCNSSSNALNASCCSYEECQDKCVDFSSGIAITIAFTTGILLIVFHVVQFGFITIFLSGALVSGYTTGAAVHVLTSQVKHVLGIPGANVTAPPGPLNVPRVWILIFENVFKGNVNEATIVISIIATTVLIVFRNINTWLSKTRCHKKFPLPIPSELLIIIVSTLVSYLVKFREYWNIRIVESINASPPPLSTPQGEHIIDTIQDAFVIAIVSYAISVSLAETFAKRNNYVISSNQELFALGISSVVGSFFSSYSPSASLSRSLIQEGVGGKTQLVALISSGIILLVLVVIAPLFEHLPLTILACIVNVALYGMFKQVIHLRKYWKVSKYDMSVWIVVFAGTVLLGVDLGLLVGVLWSIGMVVLRIILPESCVLGQVPGTEIFRNTENFQKVQPIPGIVIFRFIAPLCYLNSKVFYSRMVIEGGMDPAKLLQKKEVGCFQSGFQKVSTLRKRGKTKSEEAPVTYNGTVNPSHVTDDSTKNEEPSDADVPGDDYGQIYTVNLGIEQDSSKVKLHTIIIDCAPITFVDAIGAETLEQMVSDFEKIEVQLVFAAAANHIRVMLERRGFLKRFGKEWLFPTIQDAVQHAKCGEKLCRPMDGITVTSPLIHELSRVSQVEHQDSTAGDGITEVLSDNDDENHSLPSIEENDQ